MDAVPSLASELRQQRRDRGVRHRRRSRDRAGARRPRFSPRISICAIFALLGIELPIREIRSQHQQRVAVDHRVVARREADQPGHADVDRDCRARRFLAAAGVHDRRLQRVASSITLIVRAGAASAAQGASRRVLALSSCGQRVELAVAGGTHRRLSATGRCGARRRPSCLASADVAGQHDHRNAALRRWPRGSRSRARRGICAGCDTSSQ